MKNILVPLDFSDISKKLINEAINLAKTFKAKVWLIHVAPPDHDFLTYEIDPGYIQQHCELILEKESEELKKHLQVIVEQNIEGEAILRQGSIGNTILSETKRLNAEIVIMGSHSHGVLYHALIGGVTHHIIKNSEVPVLIIPARQKK